MIQRRAGYKPKPVWQKSLSQMSAAEMNLRMSANDLLKRGETFPVECQAVRDALAGSDCAALKAACAALRACLPKRRYEICRRR